MSDNVDLFVRLRWCCGRYVGAPKWHGTASYEPLECEQEFETTEPREEWEAGLCSAICPRCSGELSMADDHATLIEPNATAQREFVEADGSTFKIEGKKHEN